MLITAKPGNEKVSSFSRLKSSNKAFVFIIILIIALGAFLRIDATDYENPIAPNTDGGAYFYAAKNINEYGVLTHDRLGEMYRGEVALSPTETIAPGYPIFLSLLFRIFGDSLTNIYIAQTIISIMSMVVICFILFQFQIRRWILLLTMFFIASYPGLCYNIDFVLTENLFLFCILLFVLLFLLSTTKGKLNYPLFVAANIMLGIAIMTRAQGITFLVLEACFLITNSKLKLKKRIVTVAISVSIQLAFFLPLWIYLYGAFSRFIFYPSAGVGPQIWGAQPYYMEMSYVDGKSLDELIQLNLSASPIAYWNWRLFGSITFMWMDVWDEKMAHFGAFLQWMLPLQMLLVITLILVPLLTKKATPKILFIMAIPLLTSVQNMLYHGLPRYVFSAVPFVFILFSLLLEYACDLVKRKRENIAYNKENGRPLVIAFRCLYGIFLIAFSLLLSYSIFFFSQMIGLEMSQVLLNRHMQVDIAAVENSSVISTLHFDATGDYELHNAVLVDEKTFKGIQDGPMIMYFDVPLIEDGNDLENIVTKIVVHFAGGPLIDRMTLYWTGRKTAAISEEAVFGGVYRSFLSDSYTFYVPEDVARIMYVPVLVRGGTIRYDGIDIVKYRIE